MVDLALKTLLHDKLRFFITVAGVAFAVTLILVQVGLFMGLLSYASLTIRQASADLWVTSKNTPNVDFPHIFPQSALNRVRSVPGVQRADNLIIAYMEVALPNGATESAMVYAMEDFTPWNLPWKILDGDLRDLRRGKFMFVDTSAKKRFGEFQVGDYREVTGRRLKIIGRTSEVRSFTTTPIVFMDYHLAQSLNERLHEQTTYILVKLQPGVDAVAVQKEIQRRLPYNDVHTRDQWASKSSGYWVENTGLGFNMVMTIFLGCLVGVVIVAQTLYTSTMEHLREYGTVKAIGGSNLDIYRILSRQALISAVTGFVLGLIPSLALQPVVEKADLMLDLTPKFIGMVFAGTIVMCLAAAMLSFRKVASIDPALVFRG